ncbi:MAG: type II toxin-antitoxin system RelE/ParE family toxin [Mesorhizobium sp.]|nr:type II toxin-antitoxin system RelE/ParE family toxin [Mesorhizobium sp.]
MVARLLSRNFFPAGADRADVHFANAVAVLEENPYAGRALDAELRIYSIRRTPFAYIYRVNTDRIEIIRIRDQRGANDSSDSDA